MAFSRVSLVALVCVLVGCAGMRLKAGAGIKLAKQAPGIIREIADDIADKVANEAADLIRTEDIHVKSDEDHDFNAELDNPFDNTLTLYVLPEGKYEGGKCMDGNPTGYYYGPPSSGSSTTWVIFLKGGGGCSTREECAQWAARRAEGGKKGGPADEWNERMMGGGQLSSNPRRNPDFHDAHHIYVPYCTGDHHTGQVTHPTEEQWGYYFAGHLNLKAIVDDLRERNPTTIGAAASMQRVLFQGSSAGARGVYFNCDYLQETLGASVSVMCVPNSGWFFPGNVQEGADRDSPPTTFANWVVNKTDDIPFSQSPYQVYMHPDCVAAAVRQGGEKAARRCNSVHNMYQYIKAPIFAVQDIFDPNPIENFGGMPMWAYHTQQGRDYVAYFGNCMKNSMAQIINHPKGKTGDGMFLSACLNHGSNPEIWYENHDHGYLKHEAFGDWFFNRRTVPWVLQDECASRPPYLPCNLGCSGMPEVDNCIGTWGLACGSSTSERACLRCSRRVLGNSSCTEATVRGLCR